MSIRGRKVELNKMQYEAHLRRFMLAGSSYERAILALSTASLGFTFAFIRVQDLVHGACLLAFTWFFLISSIILILLTLIFDLINTSKRLESLETAIVRQKTESGDMHWTECWMSVLPMISGILFALAIMVFTVFVWTTVY